MMVTESYRPNQSPDKAERHKAYTAVLRYVKDRERTEQIPGFCYVLDQLGYFTYGDQLMEDMFPELWSQRPTGTVEGNRWWPMCEWTERKRALRTAIELSKP